MAKKTRGIRCHDDVWVDLAIYAEDLLGKEAPSTMAERLILKGLSELPPIDPTRRKAFLDKLAFRREVEGKGIEPSASALRTRRSPKTTRVISLPKTPRSQRRMAKAA